jgi:hypothetical protein
MNILNLFFSLLKGRSIYKVELNENNRFPIELMKINASDLEMTSTAVKYELLLPASFLKEYQTITRRMHLHNADTAALTAVNAGASSQGRAQRDRLVRCSVELFNSRKLTIDNYNGIVVLNKSLDREECANFRYLVRVTDLVESRLSATLTFKVAVNDLNDNGPMFAQKHYVFHIMENTVINTSIIPIRIVDPDLKSTLYFKIESSSNGNSDAENLIVNTYFGINTDLLIEGGMISLMVKKPLDFQIRRLYSFTMFVSDSSTFK